MMEEIKGLIRGMSSRQRINFFILLGFSIAAVTIFAIIVYMSSGRQTESTKELKEQNLKLIKNNEALIFTVESLNGTLQARGLRDSIAMEALEQTVGSLPGINAKLDQINKEYNESKTIAPRSYTVSELEEWTRAEAARIRANKGQ